ncbi:hypothetical protein QR680_004872 [Steinernema hermaphroditum]|uniref:Uncharacterized protein n=1 Tax=Steinernema hermaphroditum TaxID=289476 RepID=A0AA39HQ46_9BILA|nr:hypothetical protein QR680_004872 [Steinernema hermaphroditum]
MLHRLDSFVNIESLQYITETFTPFTAMDNTFSTIGTPVLSPSTELLVVGKRPYEYPETDNDGYLTSLGELEDIQLEDDTDTSKANITKTLSPLKPTTDAAKHKEKNSSRQKSIPYWACCSLAPFLRW